MCVCVCLLIEWLELNNMGYMRLIIITFLKQAYGRRGKCQRRKQPEIQRRVMSQQQDYFKKEEEKNVEEASEETVPEASSNDT